MDLYSVPSGLVMMIVVLAVVGAVALGWWVWTGVWAGVAELVRLRRAWLWSRRKHWANPPRLPDVESEACDAPAADEEECWFDAGHDGPHSWEMGLGLCAGCIGFEHCDGRELGCDCTCGLSEGWADVADEPDEPAAETATGHTTYAELAPAVLLAAAEVANIMPWAYEADHVLDDEPEPEPPVRRLGTGRADRRAWHKRRGRYASGQGTGKSRVPAEGAGIGSNSRPAASMASFDLPGAEATLHDTYPGHGERLPLVLSEDTGTWRLRVEEDRRAWCGRAGVDFEPVWSAR